WARRVRLRTCLGICAVAAVIPTNRGGAASVPTPMTGPLRNNFSGGSMDLRKLKKLIDLVEESGITELEVTEGEEKVRIAKNSGHAAAQAQVIPAAAAVAPP